MDRSVSEPQLDLDFFSHGTVLVEDLAASRRFFDEFLGLDTVQTSKISLAITLDSDTSVACVAMPKLVRRPGREYLRHYNIGLTVDDVAEAHEHAREHAAAYDVRNVGDIEDSDGRVSFLIEDQDGNFWEIVNDRPAH